jgi:hypothetical protein
MRPLLLLALAACNQWFGLDETVLKNADARADAPGCSASAFANPQRVEGTAINAELDPTASADAHELWFTRAGSSYDLFVATRADTEGAFDIATPFAYNTAMDDDDAALSADGRVLMFVSDRVGDDQLYEARRSAIGAAFDPPAQVGGLPVREMENGIDLSFDGLTLYYVNLDAELRAIQRPSLDGAFGPPSPVLAAGIEFPSLSPDELELYYAKPTGGGLYRRTRAEPGIPFGADEIVVFATGGDPDVSPDSMQLYFSNQGVFVMTRVCN